MEDQKKEYYRTMFQAYPDIVTVKQVQEMLNISRYSVYNLIKSRKIGGQKIGNGYKIPKIFIIDYVTESKKNIFQMDNLYEIV